MKINLLTIGTRGDVQPFIALGKELSRRGHYVTICTEGSFKDLAEKNKLSFSPIGTDYTHLTQSEEGKNMLKGNPLSIVSQMKTVIYPMMEQMLEDIWAASKDADAIIYHPKVFGGYDIAEALHIPAFIAHPVPIVAPTRHFTNPVFPFSLQSGQLNKASFKINRLLTAAFFSLINKWRHETLSLPDKRSVFKDDSVLNGKLIPVLYGCSPSIIPFDQQWKGHVSMQGFWFLAEDDWNPPPELLHFLEAGPPPFTVSFSSMPLQNPDHTLNMLQQAFKETGQRAILLTGSSGIKQMTDSPHIYTAGSIPHGWIFPQSRAVIHHGGAGTTAAALKAGKPMVICPFSGDQPFWARKTRDIGVAAAPLKERDMTVAAFVSRINELISNNTYSQRASEAASLIDKEDGVRHTADFIEEKLEEKNPAK
ncbi:glycosyltransferase [Bacillus inaquosorum]|uniref:glycosyltransferase n=1 Tax=Bacillus inaquosorum TaxID=483913 RepID=UPI000B43599A|nr:glycosyltransferase [Bacillus inaquosorum]ARV46680.1 glycosyl transferase [Bacillus subtilis]MEC2063817.1 glycosyltransferase [Bacillus inaquosorum]MEC2083753.1 glycosyltransferase [Bacillus inaquosorum]